MASQVYVATPEQVTAERYNAATMPGSIYPTAWPWVCNCTYNPIFAEGQPHVHGRDGQQAVTATDWIVGLVVDPAVYWVLPEATFLGRYEPPRPLQEIEGLWVCSVNTTIANPTNGQIRLNAPTVEATTILALHKLTEANVDYSAALETAVVGDVIFIQSAKEAKNWARLTLTGEAARREEAWYQVPVVWTEGSGQTFIEGNNKLLINLELSHRVDRTQVLPPSV